VRGRWRVARHALHREVPKAAWRVEGLDAVCPRCGLVVEGAAPAVQWAQAVEAGGGA
jgi:hypothetical protein